MNERWRDSEVQDRIVAYARFCECALRVAAQQRARGWSNVDAWQRIATGWSDAAFKEVQPCTRH